MGFPESFLKRVQVIYRSQALDRLDFMSVGLDCKDQAGTHRFTIEQNGAGAADPVFAANVRAGQAEFVA